MRPVMRTQSGGASNTKAAHCACSPECTADNDSRLCNTRPPLMVVGGSCNLDVVGEPRAKSGSTSLECVWQPSMVIGNDRDEDVAVVGNAPRTPLITTPTNSSGVLVESERVERSAGSSLQPAEPCAPLAIPAAASFPGLAGEERGGCLIDGAGGDGEVGCLSRATRSSAHEAAPSPPQHAGEGATNMRSVDAGELANSSSRPASGCNTPSEDMGSQMEQSGMGRSSLDLQKFSASSEAALENEKHGGDAAVDMHNDINSHDGSARITSGGGGKSTVKERGLDMGIGCLTPTEETKKATTPAISARHFISTQSPTSSTLMPLKVPALPQDKSPEGTLLVAARPFTDRNRTSCRASKENSDNTHGSNTYDLNGASSTQTVSGRKKKYDKNKNAGLVGGGMAADGTDGDSAGCPQLPPTPQKHSPSSNEEVLMRAFQGDTPLDQMQTSNNGSSFPCSSVSTMNSLQTQQGSVLTQSSLNMMSSALSPSHWGFPLIPDFISCLDIYVNTCLGLRESDVQARQAFISRIQRIVRKVLGPRAEVRVHGSITTDLALPSSDIDLLVVGYEPRTSLEAIQDLSQSIRLIDEEKLQEPTAMESEEDVKADAVSGDSSRKPHDDDVVDAAIEGVLEDKCVPPDSPAVLVSEGELNTGDPIMRVEEEEAEYRTHIEQDYKLSTGMGLASAAIATPLPHYGPNSSVMGVNSYMTHFLTPTPQPYGFSPLVGGGGGGGITAELSAPTHQQQQQQQSTGRHRLFVPTIDGPLYQVQTIIYTRVPVIKVTEKATGMKGDITFAGGEHWRSMQLTNHILKQYPTSRGLILFLKHCVRQRGMGDSQPGGVTSFTIYLLVLHFFNEMSRHLEEFLHQQECEERSNLTSQSGNEGLFHSGGTGDDNTGVSSGVSASGAPTMTSCTQTSMASLTPARASFPPQHTPCLGDGFTSLETILMQVLHQEKGKDSKQNTRSLMKHIFDYIDKNELVSSGNGSDKDRTAGLFEERTGAKLVEPPLQNAASSGWGMSHERVKQDSDLILGTNELREDADVTSKQTGNDEEVDDDVKNNNIGSDKGADGDNGDGPSVALELNNVVEGTDSAYKNNNNKSNNGGGDGNGNGDDDIGSESMHGREMDDEVAESGEEDDKTNSFRSVALRLLSTSSLGQLFYDFCYYYGILFNYETCGLQFDPLGGSRVVPKPRKCHQRGQHLFMTSPFDEEYDLTARMMKTREFQALCYGFFTFMHAPTTHSGYCGGICTLQNALEWISPGTAMKELAEVQSVLQQHQHQQQQQQQQQQQHERVDSFAVSLAKAEEQLSPFPIPSEGEKGTSLAQSSLHSEGERGEQNASLPLSAFTSDVEENPPQETRPPLRQETASYKSSSGNSILNDSSKKDDQAALGSIIDVFSAEASSLTPSAGGSTLTWLGSRTTPLETENRESAGSHAIMPSASRRQMKRRERGAEASITAVSGAAVSGAAQPSSQSATVAPPPVASAPALRPPSPPSGPVALPPHTGTGGAVGGNVNSPAGEAAYARSQYSRSNIIHQHQHHHHLNHSHSQQQQQQQKQQLPFQFPHPIPMYLVPPNCNPLGFPDTSPLCFTMLCRTDTMLQFHHHHHHHHHQQQHHYQNHSTMMPFPYHAYEMNPFFQQHAPFDTLNGLLPVNGGSSSSGGGGTTVGGGPTLSRQGGAVRGSSFPSNGRLRGRGGTHRGAAASNNNNKNNNNNTAGEKPSMPRCTPLNALDAPVKLAEGAPVDGSSGNASNAPKNTALGAVLDDPSVRELQSDAVDVKERLQTEATSSSSLAHEAQNQQHYHHHHHHHMQQAQQFALSHQYNHQRQDSPILRNGGKQHHHHHQQQQQLALWRQNHPPTLMVPQQMGAVPGSLDATVSTASGAPPQGGTIFQQQLNTGGVSHSASTTPSALSKMHTPGGSAYSLASPNANESPEQQQLQQ